MLERTRRPMHWKQRPAYHTRAGLTERYPWSDTDRAYVQYLSLRGYTPAEIAPRVERTKEAVRLMLHVIHCEDQAHAARLRLLKKERTKRSQPAGVPVNHGDVKHESAEAK